MSRLSGLEIKASVLSLLEKKKRWGDRYFPLDTIVRAMVSKGVSYFLNIPTNLEKRKSNHKYSPGRQSTHRKTPKLDFY